MHLSTDCKLKLNICPSCKLTLENEAAAVEHIQKHCPEVLIECDTCSKSLPRGKFGEHICHVKYANFRNVIELKDDVNEKLNEKNDGLATEVAKLKAEAESVQQAYERKMSELQKQLHDYQEKNDVKKYHVESSMKAANTNREYAKAAIAAPTHIKRRYSVAVNTCFRCCQDKLANDLINDANEKSKINSDYYFQNTKRMTEFAGVTGQTGKGKFCEECNRECTYIAVSGVYFEC